MMEISTPTNKQEPVKPLEVSNVPTDVFFETGKTAFPLAKNGNQQSASEVRARGATGLEQNIAGARGMRNGMTP